MSKDPGEQWDEQKAAWEATYAAARQRGITPRVNIESFLGPRPTGVPPVALMPAPKRPPWWKRALAKLRKSPVQPGIVTDRGGTSRPGFWWRMKW